MKPTVSNYNTYIFVLLITFSSSLFPVKARGEISSLLGNYGPQENRSYDPAKFRYSKKTNTYLTNFRGQLNKKVFNDAINDVLAEMGMEYGQLFSPSSSGYLGFSYISAKINSANQIKFNSSLGHFIEPIDGELFFTYRLLGTNQNYSIPTLGTVEDRVYENSFSASYTRSSDAFLRETSFNYNFSTIPGEEFYKTVQPFHSNTAKNMTRIVGGYGNTTSHEIGAQVAFGYEKLGSNLITGMKTSLGLGYEYAAQDELYNSSGQTEESVSLLAAIQQKTPFGLLNTSYKHLDSSQTLYAGYSLRGIELYLQETRCQDKKDNRLLGFLIKFDLWNPKDPFSKIKRLFGKPNSTKRGQEQIRHSLSLQSENLLKKPQFIEIIDS